MYKSVVVGTDGSATAEIALERAIELAGAMGARLHIVTAYEPATARVTGGAPRAEEYQFTATPSYKADAVLERALSRAAAEGITVDQHSPKGSPADAIVRVAEENDADLIVIGSVGMQGAKGRIFGSVPNKVSHHTPCDLLIVRTG
jgi:nucleotide-binding universal stress UspA family protein